MPDEVSSKDSVGGDKVGGDKVGGDKIAAGNIEHSVVAIGRGASVNISYYPIVLHAPMRGNFDGLIQDSVKLFAGRDRALQAISQFIQEGKGGFLVVTAPNGFGKTALVAHLIHAKPEAFAYHFFFPQENPESIEERFFLLNIVEQMALWYQHAPWYDKEQQLPDDTDRLRALYFRFMKEVLDGTQVLILDGLDAIEEWNIGRYFGTTLPSNLHVILTLSEERTPWRELLSLPPDQVTHLSLRGLERADVQEVLRAAGGEAAAHADDETIIDAIIAAATVPDHEALGARPADVRRAAEALARGEPLPDPRVAALHEGDAVAVAGQSAAPVDRMRRCEAAMPQEATVGRQSEVRVMIALPDSPGLRAHLPDWTEEGDLIRQEDVIQYPLPLEFPVDAESGNPLPTTAFVKLVAPGFDVPEPTKSIRVSPTADSGILTFLLSPRRVQDNSRVMVEMYKDEKYQTLLGSIPLMTDVKGKQVGLLRQVFRVVSSGLQTARVAASDGTRGGLESPGGDLSFDVAQYPPVLSPATEKPIPMPVEDVFSIRGRGTVIVESRDMATDNRIGSSTTSRLAVTTWQRFLQQQGYDVDVDGIFGPGTERATMEFQRRHGLPADGIVGQQTLDKARQVSGEIMDTDPTPPAVDKRTLRTQMVEVFSMEELGDICADVEAELRADGIKQRVTLDMIAGSALPAKVRELIEFLDRRGYLPYLVRVVRQHRPGLV